MSAAFSRAMLSCSARRSSPRWSRSAAFTVGSSSINTSPALTACPSCTRMDRTTLVSNGWMTLVRPLGTIFPVADATISMVPAQAQTSAAQKSNMIVLLIARPIGDGGVSMISSAAGRKASSWALSPRARPNELTRCVVNLAIAADLADLMDSCLQPMQRCVAAAGSDQHLVRAVFDQAAALERNDPIRRTYCGESMSDDQNRPSFGDVL